jgi:hypothetical protein
MRKFAGATVLAGLMLISFVTEVMAHEWMATRLRGQVLQLVDGDWLPLERGMQVPDDRVLRTMANARLTLERGEERIELGSETQVQIFEKTGRKFTTVKQYFGEVGIEADVRHVEHFSVQTQHLTAVVKGTRFVVVADADDATVSVERGRVAVRDPSSGRSTIVAARQRAHAGEGEPLEVAGAGVLPVVLDEGGKPALPPAVVKAGEAAVAAYLAAIAAGESPKAAEKAAKSAAKAAEKAAKTAEKASKAAEKSSAAASSSDSGEAASAAASNGNSGKGKSGRGKKS